jgi:hypothetical protein
VACSGGSRRAWWPCRRGARAWVRSPPPTPARRPSLRGVVLALVRKASLPLRNSRSGSRTGAANARVRVRQTAVHMVRYARLEDPAPRWMEWRCEEEAVATVVVAAQRRQWLQRRAWSPRGGGGSGAVPVQGKRYTQYSLSCRACL